MLAVPVYNTRGERVGEMAIEPAALGGEVRPQLIKQAIVAYQDHQRQDSARTKGRAQKEGSTRKLYRQKGTGNARAGSIRTPIRRGGGRAFAKRGPRAVKVLPKKMRRLARNSALLAKIQADRVAVVDGLQCDKPHTQTMASMLAAMGVTRGCVLATEHEDRNVYLSARNIQRTDVRRLEDLNAYDVLRRHKVVFSKAALERLLSGEPAVAAASEATG